MTNILKCDSFKKYFISSENSSSNKFLLYLRIKNRSLLYMNNETWQCILCEKMCIIPYENYKYITNFNKNKDIYLENIDTREVIFINFCDQCYGDDSAISCHTVSNYS